MRPSGWVRSTQSSRDRRNNRTVLIENHNLSLAPSNRGPERGVVETGTPHLQPLLTAQDLEQPTTDQILQLTDRDGDRRLGLHERDL